MEYSVTLPGCSAFLRALPILIYKKSLSLLRKLSRMGQSSALFPGGTSAGCQVAAAPCRQ